MNNYDQYADQLLHSVFENAKQTATPSPPAQQNSEDQFFNQLLARISSPAPFNNASNEWLLLQQLQQQKQLLERQQLLSALSPALASLPIVQPNIDSSTGAMNTPSSPTLTDLPSTSSTTASDEKVKKIARVPVNVPSPAPAPAPTAATVSKPHEKENDKPIDALIKATAAAALSSHTASTSRAMPDTPKPALQKKKSFLKRTWSRRDFKGRQPIPQGQKPVVQQQENVPTPKKKTTSVKAVANPPQQMVAERSSFWKPREEKPKGWWKGNRESNAQPQTYYEEEIEYDEQEIPSCQEEDPAEEEEDLPVITPSSSKQTKRVVVRRVVVPKKVPSISKPKRPMAFKTPTPKKPKSKSSKKKKNEATVSKSSSSTASPRRSMPMYVMPQQPMYYPQPMMMPSAPQPYMMGGGGGYYMMPPNGGMMGPSPLMQQLYDETDVEEKRPAQLSRKKSVYNPREASNDKCTIM
ncbi:hypothetical protein V8B55DRAFT_1542402 [Mucor lusitanicus]|uniref:Uncharacterized protein n=2 Tax=Mucor circinelloides f. lusitanicus TaxID=29924 RepID=A0A8H4BD79_MUCCL|nr:hypothetical protein FB192DRAFT_1388972 [Mucor lusitanicus]